MFKDLKVSYKIGLLTGLTILLIFVNVGVGLWGIERIRQATIRMGVLAELLDKTQELRLSLQQLVMPANDFLIVGADLNEADNFPVLLKQSEEKLGEFDAFLKANPLAELHAVHAIDSKEVTTDTIRENIASIAEKSRQILASEDARGSVFAGGAPPGSVSNLRAYVSKCQAG
mgnify:CR=1 FL=1